MRWQDYIEERPYVMGGNPVCKGARLTVEHVLREFGNGMTEDDLLAGHPRLTRNHIRAAWAFAAAVISLEETLLG